MITIALPKGRLMEESIDLLFKAGINVKIPSSRKLFFFDDSKEYRFLIVRAQDVATYVEYAVADLGIVGKDVLEEIKPELFELVDLGIGFCRMVVAGRDEKCIDKRNATVRVATKFVNIARSHFLKKGINAEIVKLYGSIELAAALGIADCIVDIVSTGRTLKENGLKIIEEIFPSTAVLVSNKISYYAKNSQIVDLVSSLK